MVKIKLTNISSNFGSIPKEVEIEVNEISFMEIIIALKARYFDTLISYDLNGKTYNYHNEMIKLMAR